MITAVVLAANISANPETEKNAAVLERIRAAIKVSIDKKIVNPLNSVYNIYKKVI